jgi:hypothetical protein
MAKLAEESVEVSKNALKTMQFGPVAQSHNKTYDNFQLCHEELDDMMAVIELLNERAGFNYTPNRDRINHKKSKLDYYHGVLVNNGSIISQV